MLKACLLLTALAPFALSAPRGPAATPFAPAPSAAGGAVVQTGSVFTGVFQGSRKLALPVTIAAFPPSQGKLVAVEVDLDVRMSGEYTIQPTPVPPNGTVESHSTTALVLGGKVLGSATLDFAPIPWVFPVSFPLNVLWALDASDARSFGDAGTLRAFTGNKPLKLTASVDVTAKVAPPGWADPHLQGVFATYEVRYLYQ